MRRNLGGGGGPGLGSGKSAPQGGGGGSHCSPVEEKGFAEIVGPTTGKTCCPMGVWWRVLTRPETKKGGDAPSFSKGLQKWCLEGGGGGGRNVGGGEGRGGGGVGGGGVGGGGEGTFAQGESARECKKVG